VSSSRFQVLPPYPHFAHLLDFQLPFYTDPRTVRSLCIHPASSVLRHTPISSQGSDRLSSTINTVMIWLRASSYPHSPLEVSFWRNGVFPLWCDRGHSGINCARINVGCSVGGQTQAPQSFCSRCIEVVNTRCSSLCGLQRQVDQPASPSVRTSGKQHVHDTTILVADCHTEQGFNVL